jgi:hypothetical protein
MYELKKIGKVFTSKSVGSGPSFYKKRFYRAAVSQRLRNTVLYGLYKYTANYNTTECNLLNVTF